LVPVCNSSFSVVLEPDLGLDHLSPASVLIPLKLVLSGCRSFVSFHSVKELTQLIVGSTEMPRTGYWFYVIGQSANTVIVRVTCF